MIKVYVDASCNQNAVGVGFVVYKDNQQFLHHKRIERQVDNHHAEFIAMITALEYIIATYDKDELIFIYSDSKVVVTAIERNSAKNEWQQQYVARMNALLERLSNYYVQWYSDKDNKMADTLAKRALQAT